MEKLCLRWPNSDLVWFHLFKIAKESFAALEESRSSHRACISYYSKLFFYFEST